MTPFYELARTHIPMQRRQFLKLSSLSTLSFYASSAFSFADQPLSPEQLYAKYVPTNKGLDHGWLKSLTTRSHDLDTAITTTKRKGQLDVVGMTVGGVACGTVYLSGDGRLWVWDIFNQHHEGVVANDQARVPEGLKNIVGRQPRERDGANFLLPPSADTHTGGVAQSFHLKVAGQASRSMNAESWKEVQFQGNWPIGTVRYRDPDSPVQVDLSAYSPFIPLQLDDSSLPLTILEYTLNNTSNQTQSVQFAGLLNNPLGQFSGNEHLRSTQQIEKSTWTGFQHKLGQPEPTTQSSRPDQILFDFESDYTGWETTGTAFGESPAIFRDIVATQGDLNGEGLQAVNSHASAPGNSIEAKDGATGTLLSPEFTITRNYLSFLIGGGKNSDNLSVQLLLNGKVISSATGHNANKMRASSFDLASHQGQPARIKIIDTATGGWGNIGVDHFVFTDQAPNLDAVKEALDYGTMALALIDNNLEATADPSGKVQTSLELQPGESRTLRFATAWHLPNLNPAHGCGQRQRHYATRFADAAAVVDYYSQHQARLSDTTKKWVATWNDSTLPQWLLDRTMLTANTLQTQNCLIFEDGRFWAWEGIGCCPGTCGHVWEYAQGHARLFPSIERNLREITDFPIGMKEDGEIRFRGSNNNFGAIDSQCAYVLRVLRDHQLSDDHDYLSRVWEPTKRALNYLIRFDESDRRGGLDGLLDGRQHNTLDAEWYGKVHVLCSMYLAALRAGEELAKRMDDTAYATRCADIFALGSQKIDTLFNGEFYEQIEDPDHQVAIGVGKGCYIDQVMGQFWSNQVGLGRLYNPEHQKAALRSLWKYNFVPEYGAFREGFKEGRHYGTPGDSGLLMCTWPKGGLRPDFKKHWQYGYFNEFMTGFEYQVAAHMIAERDPDLVSKGLAITRAVHDRYSNQLGRNPYNEIECSDHYARAGSSYAVFLALCGFHFDQALGLLKFDPVLSPENFKAPFITSESWGTYEQQDGVAKIILQHGILHLDQIELGKRTPSTLNLNGKVISLPALKMQAGDVLTMA